MWEVGSEPVVTGKCIKQSERDLHRTARSWKTRQLGARRGPTGTSRGGAALGQWDSGEA